MYQSQRALAPKEPYEVEIEAQGTAVISTMGWRPIQRHSANAARTEMLHVRHCKHRHVQMCRERKGHTYLPVNILLIIMNAKKLLVFLCILCEIVRI